MSHDPLKIAERMRQIQPSGIRKFFDLAQTMKNPIDLSIGQPHFPPPEPVARGAIRAIEEGRNKYTVTQGVPPLRDALLKRMRERLPLTERDDLMVTAGVAGGLMLTYLCVLDPGDEVIIPDPYFVMYRHLALVAGAVPVFVDTYPDFKLRREALEAAITPRTRALAINSPSNPTGHAFDAAEAKMVADVARKHDLLVISDEIYSAFNYDGRHISPREFYDNTLVLDGFSKSLGIPGWRMGYAVGPKPIIDQMRMLQQFSYVCAPSPAQWGVVAGLDVDFTPYLNDYRTKRDRVCAALSSHFTVVKPGGAFYVFLGLPEGVRDTDFVERCIERELLVVPGSACSNRNTHLRVSYAADDVTLERGIKVLREVAESYKK